MLEVSLTSTVIDLMAVADDREVSKLLYSRKDAAFALSISIRSLDYIIAAKQLKCRKVGKKVLIPAGELSRYARADHSYLTQHPDEVSLN